VGEYALNVYEIGLSEKGAEFIFDLFKKYVEEVERFIEPNDYYHNYVAPLLTYRDEFYK